jgi:hypothetical protein
LEAREAERSFDRRVGSILVGGRSSGFCSIASGVASACAFGMVDHLSLKFCAAAELYAPQTGTIAIATIPIRKTNIGPHNQMEEQIEQCQFMRPRSCKCRFLVVVARGEKIGERHLRMRRPNIGLSLRFASCRASGALGSQKAAAALAPFLFRNDTAGQESPTSRSAALAR